VSSVSIIVPTYRRPHELERCLGALAEQTRAPEQLIVVHRDEDVAAAVVVRGFPGVTPVVVNQPGVLSAMTSGLFQASGNFVGFLDDDTRAPVDWVERCLVHFADSQVGVVSGRDMVPIDSDGPGEPDPGRLGRWGRMRGGHHLGVGPARPVDVLKAANLLFRREALALPTGLRGAGAQPHFEVAMCLAAARRGWLVVFDPTIRVDHLPGPRWDDDDRGAPSRQAISDAAYNLVRSICDFRRDLLLRRAAYGLLVGDRSVPGLLRTVAAVATGDGRTARRFIPATKGQLAALRDTLTRPQLTMIGPGDQRP
jgi:glycosyltransferase involved in cell wall biosynthesis